MHFRKPFSKLDSITTLILSARLLRLLGALPYTWVINCEQNLGTGSDSCSDERVRGQRSERAVRCSWIYQGRTTILPQTTAKQRFPHSLSRKKWLVFYTHLIHLFMIVATIILSFLVVNWKMKMYSGSVTFQVAKLGINLTKTILAVFMLFYMNLKRDHLARVIENFNKTFNHVEQNHQDLSIRCPERLILVYLMIVIVSDIVPAVLNSVSYTFAFSLLASILYMGMMQNAMIILYSSVTTITATGYAQIIPHRIKQLFEEHSPEAFKSTEKSTRNSDTISLTMTEVKYAIDKVHKLQMFQCSFNSYGTVPMTIVIMKSIVNVTVLLFYVTSFHIDDPVNLVCAISVGVRDILCLIFIYCIPERVSSQVSLSDIWSDCILHFSVSLNSTNDTFLYCQRDELRRLILFLRLEPSDMAVDDKVDELIQ